MMFRELAKEYFTQAIQDTNTSDDKYLALLEKWDELIQELRLGVADVGLDRLYVASAPSMDLTNTASLLWTMIDQNVDNVVTNDDADIIHDDGIPFVRVCAAIPGIEATLEKFIRTKDFPLDSLMIDYIGESEREYANMALQELSTEQTDAMRNLTIEYVAEVKQKRSGA